MQNRNDTLLIYLRLFTESFFKFPSVDHRYDVTGDDTVEAVELRYKERPREGEKVRVKTL